MGSAEPAEGGGPGKDALASVAVAVVAGALLTSGALIGIVSITVAALVFVGLILLLLVMHGGGSALTSDISDTEGYERELEEEEQRKAKEAEESGEEIEER